jgi:hypothetical protein
VHSAIGLIVVRIIRMIHALCNAMQIIQKLACMVHTLNMKGLDYSTRYTNCTRTVSTNCHMPS